MIEIHPKEIKGSWDQGYVLDVHTISSTMIGYNEFGHPEFDTVRSQLGELVYRLKYKADKSSIPPVVETIVGFLTIWGIRPDVIVPIPPSKLERSFQPVIEIARALAGSLGIALNITSLTKTTTTQQMKDVGDFSARVAALEAAFKSDRGLEGKVVLLFDDLFQSGATMNVAARTLKTQGSVKSRPCAHSHEELEMHSVFVAGSRALSKLNTEVKGRLDNIVKQNFTVLVGDAKGADKAVQRYLAARGYEHVIVYCMDVCRNNVGNWPTHAHTAESGVHRDRQYYGVKDLTMAKAASWGFMIWDGASKGTVINMLNLVKQEKKVLLYSAPRKQFFTVRTQEDLTNALNATGIKNVVSFLASLGMDSPDSEHTHFAFHS